jgi:hypothetical protein
MNDATPDLGKPYPVGHSSGRVWPQPVSVEQAKARVIRELDHLAMAYRDRIDVGYAERCLDETLNDYRDQLAGLL